MTTAEPDWSDFKAVCEASRTNGRATQLQMRARRCALWALARHFQPASVRQIYYQATVHHIVDKTEQGYDKVQRCLVDLRLDDEMPFGWLVDNTRWMRKRASYDSLEEALERTAQNYRRDLWARADCYVEIWCEKDALAGVIYGVTDQYDVPLMVARGYSSVTFLKSAAEDIEAREKPAYVYHLGDWDPSGQNAADNIENRLREFAPNAEIHFEKIAVTPDQIEAWDLPRRPTKTTDSRSVAWRGGDSVELDAIAPDQLRQLVRDAIEQHIDRHHLEVTRVVEESEREILRAFRPHSNP
jgi:hypothetical protein